MQEDIEVDSLDEYEFVEYKEPNIKLIVSDGFEYRYHGDMPSLFHRWMQYLLFGFRYKRID